MPLYPYGYGSSKLTQAQLEGCTTVAKLHPEMWRRYMALMAFAASKGVALGVGTGWRIQPSNAGPQFAKPGNSNHEGFPADGVHGGAVAIDTVPSASWDWMEQHLAAYGLRSFRNVNSEPWHIQPSEIPASRSYRSQPWDLATFQLPEEDDVTDADILKIAATTAKCLSKDKAFLNAVTNSVWAKESGKGDQQQSALDKLREIDFNTTPKQAAKP